MKQCTLCKITSSNFGPHTKTKDKLQSCCGDCRKKYYARYFKTKEGLIAYIYSHQRSNSRKRGHPEPNYSLQELRNWMLSQSIYHELYDNWRTSGYENGLSPSCDRKNASKGYTFKNLQLMTWGENKIKGRKEKRKGKRIKKLQNNI